MSEFTVDPEETAILLIEYQNESATDGGKLHGAVKECMERTNMKRMHEYPLPYFV